MRLPRDENNTAAQVLEHQQAVIEQAFTNTSAAKLLPGAPRVITLTADEDCYYKLGGSSITASSSDWPLLAGEKESVATKAGQTHVAVIRKTTSGTLKIMDNGQAR